MRRLNHPEFSAETLNPHHQRAAFAGLGPGKFTGDAFSGRSELLIVDRILAKILAQLGRERED
jgi:hypothetical protein